MSKIAHYIRATSARTQFQPAPAGTYLAVIVSVEEEFGVTRQKFNSPGESETVDLITVICAFKDASGRLYFVTTMSMRISADPKSALVTFIIGALGTTPWTSDPNWDSQALVGVRVQLSVVQQQSKRSGRIYSRITSVAPALAQFADYAPSLSEAEIALRSYREAAAQQGPPRVVAPPGPPPATAIWPIAATSPNLRPIQGTTVPVIQAPGVTMPQTGVAQATAGPVNPASFAPPVFAGQAPFLVSGGHPAPAAPTAPVMPPPGQSPTTPLSLGQPGNAPFVPSAENPDVKF